MLRRAALLLVLATLVPGALGASSHAAGPGAIVFASDRGKDDPGEIYVLRPGSALHDVSRSAAPDYGVVAAPVGDLIAFWSDRTGDGRLYLSHGDGSHLREVRGIDAPTQGQSTGEAISFSADGSTLVASYYPSPARARVYEVAAATGSSRLLPWCTQIPSLSPDGLQIACPRTVADVVDDIDVYPIAGGKRFSMRGITALWSSRGQLAVASPHSGAEAPVTGRTTVVDSAGATIARIAGYPLAWTPDGSRLLLDHTGSLVVTPRGKLSSTRVLERDWSGPLSLSPDSRSVSTQSATRDGAVEISFGSGASRPARGLALGVWSSSGRLAYLDYAAAQGAGASEIPLLVTDRHGRNPRSEATFPYAERGDDTTLAWLPDGRLLVSTRVTCRGKDLYEVSADGGPTRQLTHDPRDLEQPSWSPDGTRIAYAVEDSTCGEGSPVHIETVAADGSGASRVTDDGDGDSSFDRYPLFSPDGQEILFQHGTTDTTSLQAVPAGGGARTTIATFETGSQTVALPTDGTRIVYLRGAWIMAIPPEGGVPVRLAHDPSSGESDCGLGGVAESPDGTQLAVAGGAGIYLVTLGANPGTRLAIRERCTGEPTFSPDGTELAFDATPAGVPVGTETAIMAANSDGSGLRTLSVAPFRQSVHPSWTAAS